MIGTLRQRDFALLWFGGLISTMGNWMLNVALPFYVYEQTDSVLATSIMFMTFWIPGILLGSVAGVFVDRWDRRRTLVASNLLQTAVVLLLLVLVLTPSQGWLWLAYAVPFIQSCINQFSGPAEGALLPSLVGQERLVPANSLNALNDNIGRLAGPPVGGMLMGLFGLGGVVLVDGLTFLFAAALISLVSVPRKHIRGEDVAEEDEEIRTTVGRWASVWQDWLRGLRIVRRDRLIAILFLVSAIATFADGILTPLLVPFADDVLGGSAADYGWLYTVRGIGGLVGGVIVAQWGAALGPARLIAVCPVIDGLVLFVIFNVPSLPLAIALFGLVSVPFVAFSTSLQTLLQSGVADEYRGRVLGALGTTAALVWLGGSALSGTMSDVLGVVLMLNMSAGFLILTGLVGFLVRSEPRSKTTGEASTVSRA